MKVGMDKRVHQPVEADLPVLLSMPVVYQAEKVPETVLRISRCQEWKMIRQILSPVLYQ